jgi:hypothetical protein
MIYRGKKSKGGKEFHHIDFMSDEVIARFNA